MVRHAFLGLFTASAVYKLAVEHPGGRLSRLTDIYDPRLERPLTMPEINEINRIFRGRGLPLVIDDDGRLLDGAASALHDDRSSGDADEWTLTIDEAREAVVSLPREELLTPDEVERFNARYAVRTGFRLTASSKIRLTAAADERCDRDLGIDTGDEYPARRCVDGTGTAALPYAATPYRTITRLLRALRLSAADTLVDIGCGKGRFVCVAARLPLRRIYGLDIDEALLAQARRNVASLRRRRTPVELRRADMATTRLPAGSVYFLGGAFSEAPTEGFLSRLEESRLRQPRPVRVVLFQPGPPTVAACARRSWLMREPDDTFSMFRSSDQAGSKGGIS